jgi:hypothetical protein
VELQTVLHQLIGSADTVTQVLAAIYIAIAVFSGEQLAGALKNRQRHIRLNPKRYIEYLNLWKACAAALALPLLSRFFNAIPQPSMTTSVAFTAAFVVLTGLLVFIIGDAIKHRRIEKKFGHISGSSARLIAWALAKENVYPEKLKLIEVLLNDTNDSDLDGEVLRHLHKATADMIKHPKHSQYAYLLATLRTLRATIGNQPLQNTDYYRNMFTFSHALWLQAFARKEQLHKERIFQLSGVLAGISRELLKLSLSRQDLARDYMSQLQTFMETLTPQEQQLYFRLVGSDLLARMLESPAQTQIWEDFPELQPGKKPPTAQMPVAAALYAQAKANEA